MTGSTKSHPYVVVGGVPTTRDKPRIALGRTIQVCCRHTFREELYGILPRTDADIFDLRRCGSIFSAARSLAGLDHHGVFTERRFTIQVGAVGAVSFIDWLPRDDIDALLVRIGQPTTLSPYPPESR